MKINLFPAKHGIGTTTLAVVLTYWLDKHPHTGRPLLSVPNYLDAVDVTAIIGCTNNIETKLWGMTDIPIGRLAWGYTSEAAYHDNEVCIHLPIDALNVPQKDLDPDAINILVVTNDYTTMRRATSTCAKFEHAVCVLREGVLRETDVSNVLGIPNIAFTQNYQDVHRSIDAGLFTRSVDRQFFSQITEFVEPHIQKPMFFGKEKV